VHIPFDLHNAQGDEHDVALFGFAHSSGSIAHYVQYADSFLCDPVVNKTKGYPSSKWPTRDYILLADRGSPGGSEPCSAATKARHAQQAGASALIIADLHCRCDNKECVEEFNDDAQCETEDSGREFLVDDGSASDISIPTVLIYKQNAVALKDEMKKGQTVLMEVTWGLPPKEDEKTAATAHLPHYHLWSTAHNQLMDLETLYNLKTVALALQDDAVFSPRFSLIDGTRFHCTEQQDTGGPCDHLCTNHGRYCALHATDLSGHAIVTETLRQLCIWNHYGSPEAKTKSNPAVWWDYLLYHKENCYKPSLYGDAACLKEAFQHAKIDAKVIDDCMKDSGDVDDDGTNSLLDEMLEKERQSGVKSLPALTVNRKVLEHMSSYGLFEGLCEHYWFNAEHVPIPKICETCGMCPNKIGCIEKGHCVAWKESDRHIPSNGSNGKKKKSGHAGTYFTWMVLIAMCAGGAWYYKKQRDQTDGRGGLLDGYMQLGSSN
jgi:hypothetical protein